MQKISPSEHLLLAPSFHLQWLLRPALGAGPMVISTSIFAAVPERPQSGATACTYPENDTRTSGTLRAGFTRLPLQVVLCLPTLFHLV